nr:MAG TPA: hypothetical protein [Caudoviricetes sp.]
MIHFAIVFPSFAASSLACIHKLSGIRIVLLGAAFSFRGLPAPSRRPPRFFFSSISSPLFIRLPLHLP